jgi:hypothetical protein
MNPHVTAGKVRRRRLSSRAFTDVRTATRNRDLLPTISAPIPFPKSSYCIGEFWPVHGGHNRRLFLYPPVSRRAFCPLPAAAGRIGVENGALSSKRKSTCPHYHRHCHG